MKAPSTSPITLPFGSSDPPYSSTNRHKGTDFAHIPDNVIYAPFAGKVTQIPLNGNDGNGTYMTDSSGRYHGLLHASKYLVPNGSQVNEGQPIAVMGETGLAFGVHLHWAVKENGQFIDPMSLIQGDDMLTQSNKDKLIKMAKRKEPTAAELSDPTYNEANRAISDFWTAWGASYYAAEGKPVLTHADIDQLWKDLGMTPTQADYDATKLPYKDFVYYFETQVKNHPANYKPVTKQLYEKS